MESEIRGPHSPPSVLVVVDQPVLAEVVRLALGHANLQARVAPSIDAALTCTRRNAPESGRHRRGCWRWQAPRSDPGHCHSRNPPPDSGADPKRRLEHEAAQPSRMGSTTS